MVEGSYTLIIKVKEGFSTQVGSNGEMRFQKGFYIYNGSAFGTGGFKRVERHIKISHGSEKYSIHWHIDHLTSAEESEIVKVFKVPEKDLEDELTEEIDLETVPGFGATDSNLESHLLYSEELETGLERVRQGYRELAEGFNVENV